MRILFPTVHLESKLVTNHSTIHFIIKQLEKLGHEVIVKGDLNPKVENLFKFKSIYYKYIRKQNYLRYRDLRVVKHRAKLIDKLIKKYKPDLIFSPGSLELSYLKSKIPKVFWTDATFCQIKGYYKNLPQKMYNLYNKIEQDSLNNTYALIFSNEKAKDSAINDYQIDENKTHFVNFGACIEDYPSLEEVNDLIKKRMEINEFKILFSGVDEYRKGLDILKNSISILQSKYKIELHIAGLNKSESQEPSNVHYHGFLRKSSKEELQKLINLFRESHVFVMPSREEASAIVYNEANSFGLPVIASDVGGTSSIITNNLNGFLVSRDNALEELTQRIEQLIIDKNLWQKMSFDAYHEFSNRLNWDSAGIKISEIINNLFNENK